MVRKTRASNTRTIKLRVTLSRDAQGLPRMKNEEDDFSIKCHATL